jgi:adenylyl- and sulfurtransferase ThiI
MGVPTAKIGTFLRRTLVGLLVVLVVLAVVKSQDVRKKYRRVLEHRLRNFLNTMQDAFVMHTSSHIINRIE